MNGFENLVREAEGKKPIKTFEDFDLAFRKRRIQRKKLERKLKAKKIKRKVLRTAKSQRKALVSEGKSRLKAKKKFVPRGFL